MTTLLNVRGDEPMKMYDVFAQLAAARVQITFSVSGQTDDASMCLYRNGDFAVVQLVDVAPETFYEGFIAPALRTLDRSESKRYAKMNRTRYGKS